MEFIIGIFIWTVIAVIGTLIWAFTDKPNTSSHNPKHKRKYNNHYNNDEEFWGEIAELNSTVRTLYGGFSSDSSSKQKRIEAKKKRLAELEKEHHWERNYDPAWDTGSYTGNDWDSEEEKLDKQIGNLEQQNLSYGQWMDFEDRRTYRDESDPTEMPDEDEYGE